MLHNIAVGLELLFNELGKHWLTHGFSWGSLELNIKVGHFARK